MVIYFINFLYSKDGTAGPGPGATKQQQASHLLDLLDINLGAGASSGPEGWSLEPPANRPQVSYCFQYCLLL